MKKGKTLRAVFEACVEPLTPNLVAQYLASIGARGGKSKSRAKLSAARANGKLGGRPKKPKRAARLPNHQQRLKQTRHAQSWRVFFASGQVESAISGRAASARPGCALAF